jgi:hypothetical protein
MKRLITAFVFLAASLAFAQDSTQERAKRSIASIQQLLQQRPDDGTLYFYLSRSQALAGDREASIEALRQAAAKSEGLLPGQRDFASVWSEPRFQEIRAAMEAKLPRLDYAPTAFQLEDRTLVPEGIAYDAPSRSFFVGSIAVKKIVRIREDGGVSDFAGPGGELDSILGIAVDAPRRVLYAVSTSALTAEGEKRRRNAVLAYDIDSRRLLQRHEVAGAQQLNDVVVAPGGRVFATDSASGAVYEISIKGPGPTRAIVPAGTVYGSNGLAASPDAKRLYVAHSTGIAVVDLRDGGVKRLENRTRESVAAIDGLYQWQGELIGVQNATNPGRVIRMRLSGAGDAITEVRTMLSHHHNALDEPTTAAVTDHGLFLLAATGVSHFNRQGLVDDPATLPRAVVLRIPL